MSIDVLAEPLSRHHHLFVGAPLPGEADEIVERRSQWDGRVVAHVTRGRGEDTERAIEVARQEFDEGGWPRLAGTERARILLRWAGLVLDSREKIARSEVQEVGKPITAARGEVDLMVELIERAAYVASDLSGESHDDMGGDDMAIVRREPVGVVAAILPWNFPGVLYAQKVPFALAAGNCVVVKPSELTSGSCLILSRLAHEAGVPAAALGVVTGRGRDVGYPLAASIDVDMLTFTGSTATAALLAAVARPFPQRQHFELGGKGAMVVFEDADMDKAAAAAAKTFTVNQGETCTSGTRLLVHASIADAFVDRVVDIVGRMVVGDPWDEATQMGPMISPEHQRGVLDAVRGAIVDGARLRTPETDEDLREKGFIAPTILTDVRSTADVFQEEIFGPVLAVTTFDTEEQALALTNATIYGLANSVWTRDVARALKLSRKIKSGMVWVNSVHSDRALLPFGGVRGSGFGREKSSHGVEEFTQLKTITIQIES